MAWGEKAGAQHISHGQVLCQGNHSTEGEKQLKSKLGKGQMAPRKAEHGPE